MDFTQQLIDFISDGRARASAMSPLVRWIVTPKLKVYLRYHAHHWVEGRQMWTFDVASVEIEREFRGTGVFTSALEEIERLSPLPVFIENVQDDRFQRFFERRGYHLTFRDEIGISCYFLPALSVKEAAPRV